MEEGRLGGEERRVEEEEGWKEGEEEGRRAEE